jgi:hypothetical protein
MEKIMNSDRTFQRHTRATRLAGSALVAGVAVATVGLAAAAVASADDRSWDVEAYDQCITQGGNWIDCCISSGGTFNDTQPVDCLAPVDEADNVPGNTPTAPGRPRPPLMPGDSVGVSDDPQAVTPQPTPTPRPRPGAPTVGGTG